MLDLTKEQLRQLQLIELELLKEVERICQKCDIHYTIIAGTMLGAVRHGGFIPWDDDADVALLRPEYEKFVKACQTELDTTRFYFQDHTNTPGYRWGYGKLRRKDTLFLREHQEHMPYEQGVFIDVFPMDGIPDNRMKRRFHDFHCFCIRKILWSEVGRIADKNVLMRKWYSMLSLIPDTVILGHYNRFIRRSNRKQTEMVRMLMFPSPNKELGYYRRWYIESKRILFEGVELEGMKDCEEYLAFTYGDYMQLPPKEQRKVHPVSAIKLINTEEKED